MAIGLGRFTSLDAEMLSPKVDHKMHSRVDRPWLVQRCITRIGWPDRGAMKAIATSVDKDISSGSH